MTSDRETDDMSTYQSVTVWQAEDFEVEVRYGFFGTVADAAAMGSQGIEGILVDGAGLWVKLRDGARRTLAPVRDCGYLVRRLRAGARAEAGERVLTIDDYEPVAMTTEEMRREPSMRSFGSQSYGVIDASGAPVELHSEN